MSSDLTPLSPDEKWALAEEERIRQNPAPPLWDEDENVEPRFVGKSVVFQKEFDTVQRAALIDRIDVDFIFLIPNFPVAFTAVITGDLPFMRALGRFDANFNVVVGPRKLTPLNALVDMMRQMSVYPASMIPEAHCGGSPNIEVAEWLLSRGVDPTIVDIDKKSPLQTALCKANVTDISPVVAQSTPLNEYCSENKVLFILLLIKYILSSLNLIFSTLVVDSVASHEKSTNRRRSLQITPLTWCKSQRHRKVSRFWYKRHAPCICPRITGEKSLETISTLSLWEKCSRWYVSRIKRWSPSTPSYVVLMSKRENLCKVLSQEEVLLP